MGYVLQGYDDRVIAGVAGRIDCQVGSGVDNNVLVNVEIDSIVKKAPAFRKYQWQCYIGCE